jgi:hypothetical protein
MLQNAIDNDRARTLGEHFQFFERFFRGRGYTITPQIGNIYSYDEHALLFSRHSIAQPEIWD